MRKPFAILMFPALGVVAFLALLCLGSPAAAAQNPLLQDLAAKDRRVGELTVAGAGFERDIVTLESELAAQAEIVESRARQLEQARLSLEKVQQLTLEDPSVSSDQTRSRYLQAKADHDAAAATLQEIKGRLASARRDRDAARMELAAAGEQAEALRARIAEAEFARIKREIEAPREVMATGEYNCTNITVAECLDHAMTEAERSAAEQGSSLSLESLTVVTNGAVEKDEIRSRMSAVILTKEVLEKGWATDTVYRVRIRAKVQGQAPATLRDQLLPGLMPVVGEAGEVAPAAASPLTPAAPVKAEKTPGKVETAPAKPVESARPAATAEAPAASGREWTVSPRSGNVATIGQALALAMPGDVVAILPGTYRESLRLDKDVVLEGRGTSAADVVIESAEGPSVSVTAGAPTLRRLSLISPTKKSGKGAGHAALEVSGGSPRVEECLLSGGSLAVLAARGDAAPELRGSVLRESAGHGAVFTAGARGVLEHCDIVETPKAAVAVSAGADPVVSACRIAEMEDVGISVFDGGKGRFEDNELSAIRKHGVEVRGDSAPALRGNSITGAGGHGLLLAGAGGTYELNDVRASELANIAVSGASAPVVTGNLVQAGHEAGIRIEGGASGEYRENQITGNAAGGVLVSGKSAPALVRNEIRGNEVFGARFERGAAGSLEGGGVSDSPACIQITSGAAPLVKGVSLSGKFETGVHIFGGGNGELSGLSILGPAPFGVLVEDTSAPVVQGCQIEGCTSAAIALRKGGSGRIIGNTLSGNAVGILVESAAAPYAAQNTVSGQTGDGIMVREGGKGTFEKNRIEANAGSGLVVRDGSTPLVTGNYVGGNGRAGILSTEDAGGGIIGNEVVGNTLAGIEVSEDAVPTVSGNIVRDGLQSGILVTSGAKPRIEGNRVSGNAKAGIELRRVKAVLQDNEVRGNAEDIVRQD